MYRELRRRLGALAASNSANTLSHGLKGLEKESLRVTANGAIAGTAHPSYLGSALTHPYITTDYSEALLELITPPFVNSVDTLAFLRQTHQYVYAGLDEELLWVTSMPCAVAGDESVPIANYGTSNSGMMRHIYRRGLAHRYGRVMQVISGVHYNYSVALEAWPALQAADGDAGALDAFISERYFGLVRNVLRYGWLLIYLFGASPALCRSFLGGDGERFEAFDASTRYAPFATSLRMSDIGYTNSTQTALDVRYDDLITYVDTLTRAIETPHPDYADIGVVEAGEYRQLNTNILQIENEFYSVVRPKQIAERGEKPTAALRRRGVAYVEVRSLDVDPFSSTGIDQQQIDFLEAFMLFCLFQESPALSETERSEADQNVTITATHGREPGLQLSRNGRPVGLKAWAEELLSEIGEVVSAGGLAAQEETLGTMRDRIRDPDETPSARVLREMRAQGQTFFHFGLEQSRQRRDALLSIPFSDALRAQYKHWAEQSIGEQLTLETQDDVSFEAYLAAYLAGASVSVAEAT